MRVLPREHVRHLAHLLAVRLGAGEDLLQQPIAVREVDVAVAGRDPVHVAHQLGARADVHVAQQLDTGGQVACDHASS